MSKEDGYEFLTPELRRKLRIPEPPDPGQVPPLEKFLKGPELVDRLEKNRERRRRWAFRYLGIEEEE